MWLLFTIGLSWSCNTVNVRKEKTGLFRSNLSKPFHQQYNHHSSSLNALLLGCWFYLFINFFFGKSLLFLIGLQVLSRRVVYLMNSKKMKNVILNDRFFISSRVCLKKNPPTFGVPKGGYVLFKEYSQNAR